MQYRPAHRRSSLLCAPPPRPTSSDDRVSGHVRYSPARRNRHRQLGHDLPRRLHHELPVLPGAHRHARRPQRAPRLQHALGHHRVRGARHDPERARAVDATASRPDTRPAVRSTLTAGAAAAPPFEPPPSAVLMSGVTLAGSNHAESETVHFRVMRGVPHTTDGTIDSPDPTETPAHRLANVHANVESYTGLLRAGAPRGCMSMPGTDDGARLVPGNSAPSPSSKWVPVPVLHRTEVQGRKTHGTAPNL
ncbi:hypothetical protein B0H12DRAFT_100065 [Mycena haematopus]|nr:hypothetical protein B0H12DRAFT_100065 [Mycena haematopus]